MSKEPFINIPTNSSTINSRRPEISLFASDEKFLKNLASIKMYLDNKKTHCNVHNNKLIYIPHKKLSYGKHDVKIHIKDLKGKLKIIEWYFFINSSSSKSENYKLFYGIPHSHTSYSTGRGTPITAFNYARKKSLDFLIITDHAYDLSKNNKGISKWDKVKADSYKFKKRYKKFLPLCGFEVSCKSLGHFNVLNTKNLYKREIKHIENFIKWLKGEDDPIVCINHPHKYIEYLKYNNDLDKYINFIEVGNGSPPFKYLNGEKYYYKLLDMGWHIGAINGQDNHRENWGDTDNLTAVICRSLNYDEFFEALKYRRTYSTETRTLKLFFKANGCWMGSTVKNRNNSLELEISVEDKKVPIKKIQLISKGGHVIEEKNCHDKSKVRWNLSLPFNTNCWYVVKVIHKNGKQGISSPIFT